MGWGRPSGRDWRDGIVECDVPGSTVSPWRVVPQPLVHSVWISPRSQRGFVSMAGWVRPSGRDWRDGIVDCFAPGPTCIFRRPRNPRGPRGHDTWDSVDTPVCCPPWCAISELFWGGVLIFVLRRFSRRSQGWPRENDERGGVLISVLRRFSRRSQGWPRENDERGGVLISVLRRFSRRSQGWPRENDERMREGSVLFSFYVDCRDVKGDQERMTRRWERRNDERMKEEWGFFVSRRSIATGQEDQENVMSGSRGWSQNDDERMSHDFTESEARMRSGVCTTMYRCMLYDVWWPMMAWSAIWWSVIDNWLRQTVYRCRRMKREIRFFLANFFFLFF